MTAITTIIFNNKLPLRKVINKYSNFTSTKFTRQMSNCIFCKIVAGDAPAEIFYQDDNVLVFKDIKPASKFHFLVIPKEHIVNVKSLTPDHVQLIEQMITTAKEVLVQKGGDVDDVRLGFHLPPFNSVSHLHLHVISPTSEMSLISRMVFRPNSWWFSTVDKIIENINNTSKL